MKVGIVVVTYNSQLDINRLLESIIIQNYKDFVVYIVDNKSTDDTLNIIQKYDSTISLYIIPCKTNQGYAAGNNIGIQKAMEEGCEFVFILNPDMQLENERCIDILITRISQDEKIGVIGPIALYGNKPFNILQGYGARVNFRTQKKDILFTGKKLTKELPEEIYVDYVHGGAMMIKTSVLLITGLLEEDYFMYNDEIDIAHRIKKAGFRTLAIREAVVRHFHDFDKKNKKGHNLSYYYIMRNKFLYFKKYHLFTNLIVSLLNEFFILPRKIIWAFRRMNNAKILKYYYSGILDGLLGKKGKANKNF